MSDLRINGGPPTGQGRSRGRGGRMGGTAEHVKVPATDFDFESANAKFDKTAAAKAVKTPTGEDITKSGEEGTEKPTEETPKSAYNPKTSFFDSLSSSASTAERGNGTGGRGRRGGGGGGARTRRDEEREKNVATFGEPGGVGLLGPGAYVGGWGGYGRRGSRPRRGGGTRGINSQVTR
jgi:protein LSM14